MLVAEVAHLKSVFFFLFGVSVMALFQAIRNSEGKFSNFYTKSKLFQEHNLIKILELYILLSIHLLYFSIKKVSYSFLDKIVKEAVSGGNRWLLKIRDLLHLVIRSPKLMLLIKGLTNDPWRNSPTAVKHEMWNLTNPSSAEQPGFWPIFKGSSSRDLGIISLAGV